MIQFSIDAAFNSSFIDRVIVSSDGEKILHVAEQLGAEPLKRPSEFSSDTASSHPLIEHAIQKLKLQDCYIILLQPTSPLRTENHIDCAFELLTQKKAESLISVYQPDESPYKAYKLSPEGYLSALINEQSPHHRRQDLPKTYYPNGAIYIFTARNFLLSKKIPSKHVIPFEMSQNESIDIDTPEDLEKIKLVLEKNNERI